MISGDSGEYEFLTEAVALSKDVEGILCEVGLRLGEGTKTIIDAVLEHRPGSTVVSIDPFGSILYTGREHIGPIRLDYTNGMYKQVMADMSAYVLDKNVEWLLFKMTDELFFEKYADGIELYDIDPYTVNKYAMAHLDGPHHYNAIAHEVTWFNERMDRGATIVIDDVTIDFVDIRPIQNLFIELGWEQIKLSIKKGIWQKK